MNNLGVLFHCPLLASAGRRHTWGDITHISSYMRCLLTPDKEPLIDQSTDTAEVPFGEPRVFFRIAYRNLGERLLTGAEMTQRQLHYQVPPQH